MSKVAELLHIGIRSIYGERLRGCYLYGSFARGNAQGDSDLDVLVVLDEISNYVSEIERTSEVVGSLSLEHALSISRVFLTDEEWRTGQTPFLSNVREEAIPL